MSFRFVKFYALFLAGLLPGGGLLAQTNSAPTEQSIIFSSPDGETVSNALLPVVEAPTASTLSDIPSEVPETIAYPHGPLERLPAPLRMPVKRNNSQSLLDEDQTSLSTPSEIMGVPTLQDIFGLPKPYATYDQKKDKDNLSALDSHTNSMSSEDAASWVKILTGDTDQDAFAADKTKSPHLPTGFFDSALPDSSEKNLQKKFQEQDDSVFGPSTFSQTPAVPTPFTSPAQLSSIIATPAPTPAFSPSAPSFNSAFSQGLSSQSPFALPTSASLGTLPQPPSLPVAAFQNNSPPPAVPPSWAPKPPPWLSQTPAFGNMGQQKF